MANTTEERDRTLIHVWRRGDGKTVTELNLRYDYRAFGLLICDIVRHVANALKVNEDAVWEWVDKERACPTTPIIEQKPS